MATWGELRRLRPDLGEAGRALLYQFGVGLAFLGTVRMDGGPRLHPMCPLLTEDGLYAFIVPSPKQQDLLRDGRYAMHSFPSEHNEDAFYLTGAARRVDDRSLRGRLAQQFVTERSSIGVPPPGKAELLFGFDIDRCLLTRTTGHGDPSPRHEVWRSP